MELEKNLLSRLIQTMSGNLLDRIYDANWSIKILQIVIFMDLVLIWQVNKGVEGLTLVSIKNFNMIGLLIIYILIFCVVVVFILPLIRGFLVAIFINFFYGIFEIFSKELNDNYSDGYISLAKLYRFALDENNTLLFNLYKEYEQKILDNEQSNIRTKNLLFGLVIFIITEAIISIFYSFSGLSLFQWGYQVLGGESLAWIVFFFLGVVTFQFFIWSIDDRYEIRKIYCPSVYHKLKNEEKRKSERLLGG